MSMVANIWYMLYRDTCDTASNGTAVTFEKMPPYIHRGGATDGISPFFHRVKKTSNIRTTYVRLSDTCTWIEERLDYEVPGTSK